MKPIRCAYCATLFTRRASVTRHCSASCYLRDKCIVMPSGCWEWAASQKRKTYGMACFDGRYIGAHRLSYETWKQPLTDGLVIQHDCDNKPCINPNHLIEGSYSSNLIDAYDRGLNGQRKLTPDIARSIAAASGTEISIARAYGVSPTQVAHIKAGRTWSRFTGVTKSG